MPRHVVLLRGVNLGPRNRVAMTTLREALEKDGFTDVATYLQSGNVVVTSEAAPETVARRVRALIKERFALDIAILVRSRAELEAVVRRNPLARDASDPKRYLVTFLTAELPGAFVERLGAAAGPGERFAVVGSEVYSWHPSGVGRSPLWERLAGKLPGVSATTRNWATVTTLLAMAGEGAAR